MVPPGKQELGLELETCCPLKQVPCGVPSPWPALLAWGGTGGEGRKVAQETKLRWRLSLLMVAVHLVSLDPFLCLVGGNHAFPSPLRICYEDWEKCKRS